ncbi:MAG: Holliday junction resolvase RuvX [bacterium]
MRTVGVDYGEKRIGVAVSDPLGMIAQPVAVAKDIKELVEVIGRYEDVQKIVVGLPKQMSGGLGIAAQKVLGFVQVLKSLVKAEVVTWDERLTTAEAQKGMIAAGLSRQDRKKVVDQSAAAIMLQSYLDSKSK